MSFDFLALDCDIYQGGRCARIYIRKFNLANKASYIFKALAMPRALILPITIARQGRSFELEGGKLPSVRVGWLAPAIKMHTNRPIKTAL